MASKKQKEIKKQLKKQREEDNDIRTKIIKALKILVGILIFMIITLLITKYANGDFSSKEIDISYDTIIAGQMFNRTESDYTILMYSYKNDTSIASTIENVSKKIYKINLDDKMNSSIIGEKNITNDIKTFKTNEAVLLEIKNGKIANVIEKSNIVSYLQSLSNN